MSNEDDSKLAQLAEADQAPENGPMQRYFLVLASAGIPGLSLADITTCLRTTDWDYFILMAYSPYSIGRESAFCRIIDVDNSELPKQVTLMPGYRTTRGFIDQGPVHNMAAGSISVCNGIIERKYYTEGSALSLRDLRTLSASRSHDLAALNELYRSLTIQQRVFFHMGAHRIIEQSLIGPLSRMQRGYLNPEARMVYTLP